MCVIAENWNDCAGGVTSDKHPEEQFLQDPRMPVDFVPSTLVKQYVPRISGDFYWCVTEVVSAVKDQGQYGSCWSFSASQAVVSSDLPDKYLIFCCARGLADQQWIHFHASVCGAHF